MKKNILKILLPILGLIVIVATLDGGGIVGFALGGGLIFAPFIIFGILSTYLLLLVFIIGFPILGAYIGGQITEQDSIGILAGLIGGGFLGFKIVGGNSFHKLIAPTRNAGDQDEKE